MRWFTFGFKLFFKLALFLACLYCIDAEMFFVLFFVVDAEMLKVTV